MNYKLEIILIGLFLTAGLTGLFMLYQYDDNLENQFVKIELIKDHNWQY